MLHDDATRRDATRRHVARSDPLPIIKTSGQQAQKLNPP
jgi:hypothetical protein